MGVLNLTDGIHVNVDETDGLQNLAQADSDTPDSDKNDNDIDLADLSALGTESALALASALQDFLDLAPLSGLTLLDLALSGYDGANAGGDLFTVDSASVGDIADLSLSLGTGTDGAPLDGIDSGLTSDGYKIYLYLDPNDDTVVYGRISLSGNPEANGTIAFAITVIPTLNSAGEITGGKTATAIFAPLDHDTTDPDDETLDLTNKLFVTAEQELSFDAIGVPSGQQLFLMFTGSDDTRGIIVTGRSPADQSAGFNITSGDTVNTSQADQSGSSIKTAFGMDNQMLDAGEGLWFTMVTDPDPRYSVPDPVQGSTGEENKIQYGGIFAADEVEFTVTQLQGGTSAQVRITAIDSQNLDEAADETEASDFVNDLLLDVEDIDDENGATQITGIVSVTVTGIRPGKGKNPDDVVNETWDLTGGDSGEDKDSIVVTLNADGSASITGIEAGFTIAYTTAGDHNRVLIENDAPLVAVNGAKDDADFDIGGFKVLSSDTLNLEIGSRHVFDDDGPVADVSAKDTPPVADLLMNLDETLGTDNYATGETHDDNGELDDTGNTTPVWDTAPTGFEGTTEAIGKLETDDNGADTDDTKVGDVALLFKTPSVDFGTDGEGAFTGEPDGRNDALSFVLEGTGATNLVATAVTGSPIAGYTDAQRAIVLVKVSDTVIEGRIVGADETISTDPTTQSADEFVILRLTLTNPTDPAKSTIVAEQFAPVVQDDLTLYDEAKKLLTTDGSLKIRWTVDVIDNDGDTASDYDEVVLIDDTGTIVEIDDDGPSIGNPGTLVLQEDDLDNARSTGLNEDGSSQAYDDARNDWPDGNVWPDSVTPGSTIDLATSLFVNAGTDAGAVFSFDTSGLDALNLDAGAARYTSKGDAVLWDIVDETDGSVTLVAFVDGVPEGGSGNDTFDDGERRVLTANLTADGLLAVQLWDQFDHEKETTPTSVDPDPAGENILEINLVSVLKVTDIEGDPANVPSNFLILQVVDDVPALSVGDLSGTGTPDPQFGEWSQTTGADEDTTLSLKLVSYEVHDSDGIIASASPDLDLGAGTENPDGSVSFTGSITDDFDNDDSTADSTLGYTATFNPDVTYTFKLDQAVGSGTTFSTDGGVLKAGGPDAVQTLIVRDATLTPTGQEIIFFSAVVGSDAASNPDVTAAIYPTSPYTTPDLTEPQLEGGAFASFLGTEQLNVSTDGIGVNNNLLDTDERMVINPDDATLDDPIGTVRVFISHTVQSLGSDEELYYRVYYQDGSSPGYVQILSSELMQEPGAKNNDPSYFEIGDGTKAIDAVELYMADGSVKIPTIEFDTIEAVVFPDIDFVFELGTTDHDQDSATQQFEVSIQSDPTPIADDAFLLTGSAGVANSYNIDLAQPEDSYQIDDFESGDTVYLLNPGEAPSSPTVVNGDSTIMVGTKTVLVTERVLTDDDIVTVSGETVVNGNVGGVATADNDLFFADGSSPFAGGDGSDSFFFAAPGDGGISISDFESGSDQIVVSASGFGGGLTAGETLQAGEFAVDPAATNLAYRFAYDSNTGWLSFDADGAGTDEAPVNLVLFGGTPETPTVDEIFVIV